MKKSAPLTYRLLFLIPLLALLFLAFSSTARAHNVSGVGPHSVVHHSLAPKSNPPCNGTNCYKSDPYGLGCPGDYSNPVTISDGKHVIATLWNVWSSYCHANWVEAQLSPFSLQLNFSLETKIYDLTAPSEQQCYPDNCSSFIPYSGSYITWSNMIDGYPKTRAVANIYTPDAGFYISGTYDR